MEPDDVGAAFTGQSPTAPQAPVEPAQAAGQWDDFLQRPGNRQALLQIGLQMMQPTGIGQTTGGAIGQAMGAGGEAVDRMEAADVKERTADSKLAQADEKLRIAQQNADSNRTRAEAATTNAATRASAKKVGGLTDLMRTRFARQDSAAYERQLERDANALVKQTANDVLLDPTSENVKKYKGKTGMEIREILRKERPQRAGAPMAADDGSDDGSDDNTPEMPPVQGAKKAQDGNWYLPDPKRQGKYLKVT